MRRRVEFALIAPGADVNAKGRTLLDRLPGNKLLFKHGAKHSADLGK